MTVLSPNAIKTTVVQAGQPPLSIGSAAQRTITDSLSGLFTSTQTTSYTAALADFGTVVSMTSTSALTATLPPNSSVAYDVGTRIYFQQGGTGSVTIVGGSGVTVTPPVNSVATTLAQGSIICAWKIATNTWSLSGDMLGIFRCLNGIILDPTGAPWIPKGINLPDWGAINSSGGSGGTNNGALLPTLFPGINFIRLNCQSDTDLTQSNGNDDPAQFATFFAICNAAKIVVFIENHDTSKTVYTGGTLTQESAWYASMAAAYGTSPYVWFGTMNEPQAPNGLQAEITAQHVATYNAIRGTGCMNPVFMSLIGGYTTNQGGAGGSLTAASYTSMVNVGFDLHYYNWLATTGSPPPYSTNYALIASTLASTIATTQAFTTSANGIMPVLIGEFGPSTDGSTADAGGTQTVLAVQHSGYGGAAWDWFSGVTDRISDGFSNLTGYGLEVAAWIAGVTTMGAVLGTSAWATLSQNPINVPPGNFDLAVTGPAVASFSIGSYETLRISGRNQTTAVEFATSFMLLVGREGSGATVTPSAAFGAVGATTAAFGSGSLNMSIISISADGSSWTLRINNTLSASFSLWVNLNVNVIGP